MLLCVAMGASVVPPRGSGQHNQAPLGQNQDDLPLEKTIPAGMTGPQWAEFLSQYPVVDYDALKPDDPEKIIKRSTKSSRFDKHNFVSKDPANHVTVSEIYSDARANIPALPTAASEAVVIGEVLDAQAHLSNDKTGIYSEFTIRVNEVLKGGSVNVVSAGSTIVATRIGGIVRYHNGHRRLHHISGEGMPRVGKQYLLFLKSVGQDLYSILTGYELAASGMIPVDYERQFAIYRGYEKEAFLKAVRDAIAQP